MINHIRSSERVSSTRDALVVEVFRPTIHSFYFVQTRSSFVRYFSSSIDRRLAVKPHHGLVLSIKLPHPFLVSFVLHFSSPGVRGGRSKTSLHDDRRDSTCSRCGRGLRSNYCARACALVKVKFILRAACAYTLIRTNWQNDFNFAQTNTRNGRKMSDVRLLFHTLPY